MKREEIIRILENAGVKIVVTPSKSDKWVQNWRQIFLKLPQTWQFDIQQEDGGRPNHNDTNGGWAPLGTLRPEIQLSLTSMGLDLEALTELLNY